MSLALILMNATATDDDDSDDDDEQGDQGDQPVSAA